MSTMQFFVATLKQLQKGSDWYRIPRSGAPKRCTFHLFMSPHGVQSLGWDSKTKTLSSCTVELRDCELILGQTTAVFMKNKS
eukprot:TRINITY_DN6925_c0_g1_i1.p2 TRINITY_DN6925_c0_g1~~TRINITY_DN6925_c0_g1_i1.p2  ORF type:complete len:82 (-),score=11.75 TRINITY_DN6925_c0_g1_i1:285-530(-)